MRLTSKLLAAAVVVTISAPKANIDTPGMTLAMFCSLTNATSVPSMKTLSSAQGPMAVMTRTMVAEPGACIPALSGNRTHSRPMMIIAGNTTLVSATMTDSSGIPNVHSARIPDTTTFSADEARAELGRSLPDYMIPSGIVALTEFPLSPNGKVERKLLPAPELPVSDAGYIAPRNETEQQLSTIWAQLLGTDHVGINDDFFALGGHSLVAMQLVSRIAESMHVQLPLDVLFNATSIAAQAKSIDELRKSAPDAAIAPTITRSARRGRRLQKDD